MQRKRSFYLQLAFTLAVCAFLIVPVFLSVMAGVTENFFVGIRSGLTLRWIGEVWGLYSETIYLSLIIAIACLAVVLAIGVPAAYVLARRGGMVARFIEETIVLPVAVPGLAIALALIITYGGFRDFRSSGAFILVGHVLYTLPFMVRSVLAVLSSIDFKVLEESAAPASAPRSRSAFSRSSCRTAGRASSPRSLMVVTLSVGEFNLTWMLHTPVTKTLPVGLADSYASMRLEVASAYTLVFFIMIVPLLIAMQMMADAKVPGTRQPAAEDSA